METPRWSKHILKPMPLPATTEKKNVLKLIPSVTAPPQLKVKKNQ